MTPPQGSPLYIRDPIAQLITQPLLWGIGREYLRQTNGETMSVGLKRIAEYRELFEQCQDRDSELQMLAYTGAWGELKQSYHWIQRNRPQFTMYLEPMEKLLSDFPQLPQMVYDQDVHTDKRYDRLEMLASRYTDTSTLQGLYAAIAIRRALDTAYADYRAGDTFRSKNNGGVELPLSADAVALREHLNRIRDAFPNPRDLVRDAEASPSP